MPPGCHTTYPRTDLKMCFHVSPAMRIKNLHAIISRLSLYMQPPPSCVYICTVPLVSTPYRISETQRKSLFPSLIPRLPPPFRTGEPRKEANYSLSYVNLFLTSQHMNTHPLTSLYHTLPSLSSPPPSPTTYCPLLHDTPLSRTVLHPSQQMIHHGWSSLRLRESKDQTISMQASWM